MYESWFGLSKRPFHAAPQTVDYFADQGIDTALDAVIRCIERSAGPAVVIGENGMGKSLLAMMVMRHFRPLRTVAHIAGPGIRSRKELLQTILFEFGLPYAADDEGQLRLSLVDFLTSRDVTCDGAVLIVDDAHRMTLDLLQELAALSDLVRDQQWCTNLILFGQSTLDDVLARRELASLNQRIAARHYLRPWNLNTTTDYVDFQLRQSGVEARQIFTPEAFSAINDKAKGVPRLINQLCDHALVLAATGGTRTLNENAILEAWSDLQSLPTHPDAEFEIGPSDMSVIEFGALDDEEPPTPQQPIDSAEEYHLIEDSGLIEESGIDSYEDVGSYEEVGNDQQSDDVPSSDFDFSAPDPDERPSPGFAADEIRYPEYILDEIERQLFAAEGDVGELPSDVPISAEQGVATDPFQEQFDEEEMVVAQSHSLNIDLVTRQPSVRTRSGAALIDLLRTLESENGSTSPDEINGPTVDVKSAVAGAVNLGAGLSVESTSPVADNFASQQMLGQADDATDHPETMALPVADSPSFAAQRTAIIPTDEVTEGASSGDAYLNSPAWYSDAGEIVIANSDCSFCAEYRRPVTEQIYNSPVPGLSPPNVEAQQRSAGDQELELDDDANGYYPAAPNNVANSYLPQAPDNEITAYYEATPREEFPSEDRVDATPIDLASEIPITKEAIERAAEQALASLPAFAFDPPLMQPESVSHEPQTPIDAESPLTEELPAEEFDVHYVEPCYGEVESLQTEPSNTVHSGDTYVHETTVDYQAGYSAELPPAPPTNVDVAELPTPSVVEHQIDERPKDVPSSRAPSRRRRFANLFSGLEKRNN